MRVNRKRCPNDGGTIGTAYLSPVPASAVETAPTQRQIENTIDALRRLAEAIEDFQKKRGDAKTQFVSALAKDLATGPLNVERAIAKHKLWKAIDESLASKIQIAEELRPIIEELIEELKRSQPDALKAALHRKLKELAEEVTAEQEEAALLKEQIDNLRALLQDIEKPATVAKSRKR